MGPMQKIAHLAAARLRPSVLGRFVFDAARANVLKRLKDSFPPLRQLSDDTCLSVSYAASPPSHRRRRRRYIGSRCLSIQLRLETMFPAGRNHASSYTRLNGTTPVSGTSRRDWGNVRTSALGFVIPSASPCSFVSLATGKMEPNSHKLPFSRSCLHSAFRRKRYS